MHHHPLPLVMLVTLACSSPPTPQAALAVSSDALEWLAVAGDEPVVQHLVVRNDGDEALLLTPLLASADARFALEGGGAPRSIPARSTADLAITFDPEQATPALAWLHLITAEGAAVAVRLRAEVGPRSECVLLPLLTTEYGQQLSPVRLEVRSRDGAILDGPWRWTLAELPDLKGPRLFADDLPYGLAVGLGASPPGDEAIGGGVGHLNLVTHSAPHTVRVRDDEGRGCEATFFADERIPGGYPGVAVLLTWLGEADLDLHVARVVDGAPCFSSPQAPAARRCDEARASLDCGSRRCDADDWNGELYQGFDDEFHQPRRHPTGQGAELIAFSGNGGLGTAAIAVEAVDAAAPVTFRLRVFHQRLAIWERTGVVLPGELREVTTTTF